MGGAVEREGPQAHVLMLWEEQRWLDGQLAAITRAVGKGALPTWCVAGRAQYAAAKWMQGYERVRPPIDLKGVDRMCAQEGEERRSEDLWILINFGRIWRQ
jgi:hypothetical protein